MVIHGLKIMTTAAPTASLVRTSPRTIRSASRTKMLQAQRRRKRNTLSIFAMRKRAKSVLHKFVHLMNSLQIKSGSELAFPILFGHLSFGTHRTWEMNMKVPYARALSSWEKHYKTQLKSLHQNIGDLAINLGYSLPDSLSLGAEFDSKVKQLPKGSRSYSNCSLVQICGANTFCGCPKI